MNEEHRLVIVVIAGWAIFAMMACIRFVLYLIQQNRAKRLQMGMSKNMEDARELERWLKQIKELIDRWILKVFGSST